MIDSVRQIIREDRRRTTYEVSLLVGISHGACHKILTCFYDYDPENK
jgi:hypothetical protein